MVQSLLLLVERESVILIALQSIKIGWSLTIISLCSDIQQPLRYPIAFGRTLAHCVLDLAQVQMLPDVVHYAFLLAYITSITATEGRALIFSLLLTISDTVVCLHKPLLDDQVVINLLLIIN